MQATYYLNDCGVVCALGATRQAIVQRLWQAPEGSLTLTDAWSAGRVLPLGVVDAALPSDAHLPLPERSRNNRLLLAALAQIRPAVEAAIARFGAQRIGVVLGTSTSGIAETEAALTVRAAGGASVAASAAGFPPGFHYGQQEMGSPAAMLAGELKLAGPAYVHSSACSSSAKAMASAARLINMGLCDAVLTGGADSLCAFTVAGFSSLESISPTPCNPLSAHRNGINIGEGAALFLMSREASLAAPGAGAGSAVALRGWGESSDGHHMSAPDPAGGGARLAMQEALRRAGIAAGQIDYVNLHGTATVQNDAMESRVIEQMFGSALPVSSTKPLTGHTLGAAAAIEAALCWLCMQDDNPQGRLPPHLWDGAADPALPALQLALPGAALGRPLDWALSNSFAFGGSNAVLILGRAA